LSCDQERSRILGLVQSLHLPDCWIGAGFVRDAVWDDRHGRPPSKPDGDVDVVWFDPRRADPAEDRALQQRLKALDPDIAWAVKNQSRMYIRNDDAPYASVMDALRFWPETATSVAVRQTEHLGLEIAAPFGLDDLFGLIVTPGPRFHAAKRELLLDRVRTKQWLRRWPGLTLTNVG
jgi:hypothetical protein